jgi:hypothetical protein
VGYHETRMALVLCKALQQRDECPLAGKVGTDGVRVKKDGDTLCTIGARSWLKDEQFFV